MFVLLLGCIKKFYLQRNVEHVSDHREDCARNRLDFLNHKPSYRLLTGRLGSGTLVFVISELHWVLHCLLVVEQKVHHLSN